MTKLCGALPKLLFFHVYGGHFRKKNNPKTFYQLTNLELSNFKTKKSDNSLTLP